jgi:hypothetical protein
MVKYLYDKVESIVTHCYWALRNCYQDPQKLQKLLLNVVEHYIGNHAECLTTPQCRVDKNYKPSRFVIVDKISEKLLREVIINSTLYKNADNYVMAKDKYYVESFNNTMNKRIAF